MTSLLEKLIAKTWNGLTAPEAKRAPDDGLFLGFESIDDVVTNNRVRVPTSKRPEHLAVLGKTGLGKSRLLLNMAAQDIINNQGFLFCDFHGDSMPQLLARIAAEELRRGIDLSRKLIVIEPADLEFAVGINVLDRHTGQDIHVQLAEFAQLLKTRWHLDSFGARTEELLRESLYVLAHCGLTIVELVPLLTNAAFRAECLARTQSPEIVSYFRDRFDVQSEAMQGAMRDPILNKVSAFIVDEKFRHILGQRQSTFSLIQAIDDGCFIILHLDKGRLGEQVAVFAGLFLTRLKNALFARRSKRLFTLYCDEVQNLVAYDTGLETLLSEARKFGVSVVTANQFSSQYPEQTRAALAAVGTHIYFQLSGQDADKVASSLDGGRRLAETLKNLPRRNVIVKSGHERYRHAVVPTVADSRTPWTDLYNRSRQRWARRRTEVEADIRQRQPRGRQTAERVLNDWE